MVLLFIGGPGSGDQPQPQVVRVTDFEVPGQVTVAISARTLGASSASRTSYGQTG